MPYKPKRPCSYPGCPRLTDSRFCLEHQREDQRRYSKYERNPASQKRYGRAWKKIRERFLEEHPYCVMCSKSGKRVPATVVHHIRPLSEGGSNEEDNLMALCNRCHSSHHSREGDRWKRKA